MTLALVNMLNEAIPGLRVGGLGVLYGTVLKRTATPGLVVKVSMQSSQEGGQP